MVRSRAKVPLVLFVHRTYWSESYGDASAVEVDHSDCGLPRGCCCRAVCIPQVDGVPVNVIRRNRVGILGSDQIRRIAIYGKRTYDTVTIRISTSAVCASPNSLTMRHPVQQPTGAGLSIASLTKA
jgi:hypothetical protein